MTDQRKSQLSALLYSILGAVVAGLTLMIVSGFSSERVNFQKELNRLDKVKADVVLLDERMMESERRTNDAIKQVYENLDRLNSKTDKQSDKIDKHNDKLDRILELMIKDKR